MTFHDQIGKDHWKGLIPGTIVLTRANAFTIPLQNKNFWPRRGEKLQDDWIDKLNFEPLLESEYQEA
jgi:hypothetical protein